MTTSIDRPFEMSDRRTHDVLDPDDPTPLYHQIYVIYRQLILAGALRNGDRLPSEAELSAKHDVSRITARRAMNELAQKGLVSRSRGKGTIVNHTLPATSFSGDFGGLMENLIAIDAHTSVEVLSFDYVSAPPAVAEALKLGRGAKTQRAERLRSSGTQPFSYILTYLPAKIGRSFNRADLGANSILSLIERSGHDVHSAKQSVSADIADADKARHLDVEQGAPLLKVTRVVSDSSGTPVQYIEIHYRTDAYQLNMELSRVAGENSHTKFWVFAKAGLSAE